MDGKLKFDSQIYSFSNLFLLSVQVFFEEDERTTTRESHSDPQWDNESLDANAEPCPLLVLTALWLWRRGFTHVLGGMLVSKTSTNIDLLYVRVLVTWHCSSVFR